MKNLLKISGILLSLILAVSLIQGSEGNGSDGALRTTKVIETDNYTIRTGETVEITDDLIIQATGTVNIMGSLVAVGDNGQNITIRAKGDINISGIVTGGKGGAGEDGGTLTIISLNGSVSISGTISAGDGGDGIFKIGVTGTDTEQSTQEDAGGNGGHLILRASNGSIDIAGTDDIIHIGNGGKGADIEVHGKDLRIFVVPEELTNGGGHSGGLILDSPTINGVTLDTVTLDDDFPPDSEDPLYRAEEEVIIITSNQVSGGNGGDAGTFNYGVDKEGNSTWPQAVQTGLLTGTNVKKFEPFVSVFGDSGGWGFFSGTDGQSVVLRGENATDPGDDGQSVAVSGGFGGNAIFGIAGNGGKATAHGGNGANGEDPDQKGGNGGNAEATGGLGGIGTPFKSPGGDAEAFGGRGADGGDGCPPGPEAAQGGRGGDGGVARAFGGGFGDPLGDARAVGGNGGSGRDGRRNGGGKGGGGDAFATDGNKNVAKPGLNGEDGERCPFSNISITVRINFSNLVQIGDNCQDFFKEFSDIFTITTLKNNITITQPSTNQVCNGTIDIDGNFKCQGQKGQVTFSFTGQLNPDGTGTVLHSHVQGGCTSTWNGISTPR